MVDCDSTPQFPTSPINSATDLTLIFSLLRPAVQLSEHPFGNTHRYDPKNSIHRTIRSVQV